MRKIRRADERGGGDHGWLKTRHTFSFADYHDPRHMGFRSLRVINEDRVAPGAGFGTHPHRDMEIVTYVLEGALEHKDSMGNGSVIRPGEVQRMSAGTGITHSEKNASKTEPVHFLQIWILPSRGGLPPSYEQKSFADAVKGTLKLVGAPDGAEGAVTLHQDCRLYASKLERDEAVSHELAKGRHAWVHIARGSVEIAGEKLGHGDSLALSDEPAVTIRALAPAELLVFDLA